MAELSIKIINAFCLLVSVMKIPALIVSLFLAPRVYVYSAEQAGSSTFQGMPGNSMVGRNRIVGGVKADIAPFIVAVEVNGNMACGAAVIHDVWAVTAGHCCAWSLTKVRLRAGTAMRATGGVLYEVAQKIRHSGYNKSSAAHDICLLRVKTPFKFNTYVQPIACCSADSTYSAGQIGKIIGWGRTSENGSSSDILLMADVSVIARDACRRVYGDIITEQMICAGDTVHWKVDACQGDSGGPLVLGGCLAGVVSWGFGCARQGQPGVYTDLAKYCLWIASNTGIATCVNRKKLRTLTVDSPPTSRPVQISIN